MSSGFTGGSSRDDGGGPRPAGLDRRFDIQLGQLERIIRQRVVPELVESNRLLKSAQRIAEGMGDPAIADQARLALLRGRSLVASAPAFAEKAQRGDVGALLDDITHFKSLGLSWQRICLDLIAPAARLLGDGWLADTLSFAQVSAGLSALLPAMRAAVGELPAPEMRGNGLRRILVLPTPNDRHVFGAQMLGEFFQSAGWDVDLMLPATRFDCIAAVSANLYDVVGVSLARTDLIPETRDLVAEIRSNSRNPQIMVMVGGPAISAGAGACEDVGADATAETGQEAVIEANMLLDPDYALQSAHGP
jgi:MerR family transcriptional regulator, light-induced transcriptional regulator